MDAKQMGTFIADRRKELGLTQALLADKLHVTDKAVSRWERGVGLPDINSIEALAEALEVSLVELIRAQRSQSESISIQDAEKILADTIQLSRKGKAPQIVGGILLAGFGAIGLLLLYMLITAYSEVAFPVSSLATGLIAWAVPIWQMTLARKQKPVTAGIVSFGFAMAAVAIQFFQLANEVHTGDLAAIIDTIDGLGIVVVLFSAVTLLVNLSMAWYCKIQGRKKAEL